MSGAETVAGRRHVGCRPPIVGPGVPLPPRRRGGLAPLPSPARLSGRIRRTPRIRDRDGKFPGLFDEILADAGIRTVAASAYPV